MKYMIAIVKPVNLDDFVEALKRVGVRSITVNETKDYGQTGHAEFYRAAEYTTKFVPMLRIEFAVASSQVESVSEAIAGAVQSGQIGDIKIFVLDLASEMVLRTSKNDGITPRQAA